LPDHLDRIALLRRELVLKMFIHFFEPLPHPCPSTLVYTFNQSHQVTLFDGIRRTDKNGELGII
jgi:hypothetical protein